MADNLVPITIDGQPLEVPRGTLVVEAARQIGVEIPVYCYHPKMKPVGACRVCMVEIEGQRAPVMAACTTEVMPNMVVHTRSDKAVAAREGVLEFLLINHPLDCPVCDRGGECDLQDFVLRYGQGTTRFIEQKRHFAKSKQVGKNVLLDRERCIMCQRCVRFCNEIAMEEGLVIVDRGNRSEIGTFADRSFDSQYSGNTIELCPVGALTAKSYRFNARPWEQQHYAGLCNHCSVGCNITVDVRFDEVVRFRSRCNDEIDDGWLCDQGRYGFDHIHAENRLETPLKRNASGTLEPISWENALCEVAEKLKQDGPVDVLLGSQLSLEDGHVWMRVARGLAKNGSATHQSANEALHQGLAQATGRVVGCDDAEVIVCVGSHPHATHAGVDLRIKKGLRRGAKLVSLNAEPVMEGLADFLAVGEPSALWKQLLGAIDALGEAKEAGLKLPAPRPWEAGGSSSQDWDKLVEAFRGKTRVLVIAAGDLSAQGLDRLPESVQARGWASAPHGLLHLRRGANAVGLDGLGCQPNLGKDGSRFEAEKAYSHAWGSFSSRSGKSFAETARSGQGTVIAVGSDPLALEGAKKPSFLIACATAPNATTEKADLVLPMSTWVESHGVFVSTDGTIQLSRQAVMPVGRSQPAWAIASAILKFATGGEAPYKNTRQVFAEIGELNPTYGGLSYANFEQRGEMHWSYPQQADLGMPRPDLSAIPVPHVDTPMWMPLADTGSKVEAAARITRGDRPPTVPGQDDPRRIAAMLGLAYDGDRELEAPKVESPTGKAGYIPLRVVTTSGAQPPGPTPAKRHQKLGVGAHVAVLVPSAPALPEAEVEEAGVEAVADAPAATPAPAPDKVEKAEKAEAAPEKTEKTGDSNVATIDVVTENKVPEGEVAESSQAALNDGKDSQEGADEEATEAAKDSAEAKEPEGEPEQGASKSQEAAPVTETANAKSDKGSKGKKSKGKASKEKKK